MFREMRRKNQQLTDMECMEILRKGKDGVLSLQGDDGYPYGVPLNYYYDNGKIYFHCAKSGHKYDAIKNNDKLSFCVVDKRKILPELYATHYTSVIVFGRARIMDNPTEMREKVMALAAKYCPDDEEGIAEETDRDFPSLAMIEITIEHMTGKMSKDIMLKSKPTSV